MHFILRLSYSPADAALEDRVEALLFLTRCLGSQIGERDGETVVSLYFSSAEDRAAARNLAEALHAVRLEEEDAEEVDWLQLYRQSLSPLFIGERFVVVPDRELLEPGTARIVVVIPQERAFGTGSHESTALCLEMLEELPLEGSTALDIGTGSGILALAMEKLGARKVFAFDNDPETWEVVPKNLGRNDAARVAFFIGGIDSVLRAPRFDAIAMNILPEVILPNLPAVASLLAPGGSLVLSGILVSYRDEVVEAAKRAGLSLQSERTRGEWWCGRVGRT